MSWNELYQQSDKYMKDCCWWEGYWKRKFANHKRACLRDGLMAYLDYDKLMRKWIEQEMSEAQVKEILVEAEL